MGIEIDQGPWVQALLAGGYEVFAVNPRQLGNRWVGILHGCLEHHTHYDEHTAWAHRAQLAA